MRLFLLGLFVILFFSQSYSQELRRLGNIDLNSPEDFLKAEKDVIDASDYLLDNPLSDDLNRSYAVDFILLWLEGTEKKIEIGEEGAKLSKKQKDLLGIYMAALIKSLLEKPEMENNQKQLKKSALEIVAEYCIEEDNKVIQTKYILKLIDSYEDEALEEFID